MRINEVLECLNVATGSFYVAHSSIKRNIGAIKTATTIIENIGNISNTEVIKEEITGEIPVGREEEIIERSRLLALTKLFKKYDTRT